MKIKLIGLICFLLIPKAVLADYAGSVKIARIYVNQQGLVSFGTSPQVKNTCNYYGFHFKFDSSTGGGKSMYSLLLSAKLAEKKVDLWYTSSSSPNTDQKSGCTSSKLSIATHIGIQ